MINHISLTGKLCNVDDFDKTVRYIEVRRNYKDCNGIFQIDRFPCRYWTKDEKGNLFTYKENALVAIDGRIEIEIDKVYIIIESIVYLGS